MVPHNRLHVVQVEGAVACHVEALWLSAATLAVLRLRQEGKSYAGITEQLGIQTSTISWYLRKAKDHFGLDTPEEAVSEAKARGLRYDATRAAT